MFDFISDNPVAAIFILYGLYRLLRRKKSPAAGSDAASAQAAKARAAANEARLRASNRKAAATASSMRSAAMPLEQRLQEIAQQYERTRDSGVRRSVSDVARIERPDAAAGIVAAGGERMRPESASLEAASLESESYDSRPREHEIDRTSETAVDYDKRSQAFEYRSAMKVADSAFHLAAFEDEHDPFKSGLDSFKGFQSASGAHVGTAEVEHIEAESTVVGSLFGSGPADVRRAFLLSEILGRPQSVRMRTRFSSRPR